MKNYIIHNFINNAIRRKRLLFRGSIHLENLPSIKRADKTVSTQRYCGQRYNM